MASQRTVDITDLAVLSEQFPLRLMHLGFRVIQVIDGAGQDQACYVIPPVCKVPAGPFLMGSDKQYDHQADDNELPRRLVDVPTFQIGIYPVTVAEYAYACRVQAVREPPPAASGLL
jgi:formylglycine-generating enzyme required for sulfatase activity